MKFRITSAPEASLTKFLEALLRSESINTIRNLGVVGQKFDDEGIFALLTISKHATNLDPGQPDTLLTEVTIESRSD